MTIAATASSDQARRLALTRYRLFATGLLLAMAAVYAACRASGLHGFWIGLVEAAAEAALVGGLADWFAITALFRRPLGLPIPHTAVIPRNKDRIGEGLGRFIETNFLDPELIETRLDSMNLAARAGRWLTRPESARLAADRAIALLPTVADAARDERLRRLIEATLLRQIRSIEVAPVLAQIVRILRQSDHHHALFDAGLEGIRTYIEENRGRIHDLVEARSAWWLPKQIDRRVAEAILSGVSELLDDLSREEHEVRQRFGAALDGFVGKLESDPEMKARVRAIVDGVLARDEVRRYFGRLVDELQEMLAEAGRSPSPGFHDGVEQIFRSLGQALAEDEQVQAGVNQALRDLLRSVIVPFRGEIGRFVADVVRGWEAETVSERIEIAVGRDLQYIRINGTIVGALIGTGLYLLSVAFP